MSRRLDDPRIRYRFYIDGTLADESWVDVTNPDYLTVADTIERRQKELAAQADADGLTWCAEFYDAADHLAPVRFGTGPAEPTERRP